MTGGISQFVRAYESVAADTPLADRWQQDWDALTDRIDAFAERTRLEHVQREQERIAIIARFGLPDSMFTAGPPNPALGERL